MIMLISRCLLDRWLRVVVICVEMVGEMIFGWIVIRKCRCLVSGVSVEVII